MLTNRITQLFVAGAIIVAALNWERINDIGFVFPYCSVLAGFYFLKLFENFGKRIVLIDVLELLCVVYLLFTPSLFEQLDKEYLQEIQLGFPLSEKYFPLAIPSVLALLAAFSLPLKERFKNEKMEFKAETNEQFQKIGLWLFVVGISAGFLKSMGSFGFLADLLAGLSKVGVLYLLFSNHKFGRIILFSYLGIVMLESLGGGMIGEFFWWIALLGMYYLMIYRISLLQKLGYAVLFFFSIGLIQSVKAEYRLATWSNEGELAGMSPFKVYSHLINDKLSYGMLFSPEESLDVLARFNQGYLTGMTLDYTPENEPFAKGETIYTAIASSLVPRVLWPDKPEAGGRDKMLRFAGIELGETTAMNIGILGEAYVNFGFNGAAVLLFFYGLLLNFVYSSFLAAAQKRPFIVLWMPVAFFGLISFETDFVTTLNHLVKFMLFFAVFYYGMINTFRIKPW